MSEAARGLRLVGGGDASYSRGSGAGVGRAAPRGGLRLGAARDWAELLRVSALFTVPGDALAGAAATGLRPNRRTLLAIAASLSLYEAGMALNDWADREEDAIERPHRPLPSGRIAPPVALGAAAALTAGGLALAAGAGRPALTVASGLAATVWAYDLGLKHTPAGPAAMATARALDLLLGAAATSVGAASVGASAAGHRRQPAGRFGVGVRAGERRSRPLARLAAGLSGRGRGRGSGRGLGFGFGPEVGAGSDPGLGHASGPGHDLVHVPDAGPDPGPGPGLRAAGPAALVLGAHTLAVTAVSRREAQGGSTAVPLAALAATAALAQLLARRGGAAARVDGGRGDGGGTRKGTGAGSGRCDLVGTGIGAAPDTGVGTSTAITTSTSTNTRASTHPPQLPVGRGEAATRGLPGFTSGELTGARLVGRTAGRVRRTGGVPGGPASGRTGAAWRTGTRGAVQAALAATYAATAARPLFHAALNPSPQLTQRAVGGGIRAMIPLQATLSARTGALGPALLTVALAPAARKFGRKVSVT
ncbi:UbiA family prenyltransferase [Streptomyces sp. NBC_01283]|uniref:UbiA family prenyltransferase n=1 Tax=Streptomyces sp. NBC_01283 TaxID=2903812 RepID=UPI00352E70B0